MDSYQNNLSNSIPDPVALASQVESISSYSYDATQFQNAQAAFTQSLQAYRSELESKTVELNAAAAVDLEVVAR